VISISGSRSKNSTRWISPSVFLARTKSFAFVSMRAGSCLTGCEPAGQLARKLSYYLKDHASAFDAEGRFLPNFHNGRIRDDSLRKVFGDNRFLSHFHLHTCVLLNMLEYALPADDHHLMAFIVQSYEWARAQGESRIVGARRRASTGGVVWIPGEGGIQSCGGAGEATRNSSGSPN
jgi:hypothetical protein